MVQYAEESEEKFMKKVKTSEYVNTMQDYYDKLEEQKDNFEKSEIETEELKDVKMIKMPICRQAHDFTCGVACVQSALRYAGYDFDTREDKLLKRLDSTPENGTSHIKIKDFLNSVTYGEECKPVFRELKWQTFNPANHKEDKKDQIEKLKDNLEYRPVMCIVQAWKRNDSEYDYSEDRNDDGHYVIAVGTAINFAGEGCIIFMDPSTSGGYTYMTENELKIRWHDADDDIIYECFGLVLDYIDNPKSEESTFYKLG